MRIQTNLVLMSIITLALLIGGIEVIAASSFPPFRAGSFLLGGLTLSLPTWITAMMMQAWRSATPGTWWGAFCIHEMMKIGMMIVLFGLSLSRVSWLSVPWYFVGVSSVVVCMLGVAIACSHLERSIASNKTI